MDETVTFAKQTGYAETMYGRRRPIPELRIPAQRMFGERTAMNHPMQDPLPISSRSPWCVSPSACAPRALRQNDPQVHDELDFECPVGEVDRLIAMVREEMEGVAGLRVPHRRCEHRRDVSRG
ncbi:MAG: DNA polymerase [Collinsella intestinalis]